MDQKQFRSHYEYLSHKWSHRQQKLHEDLWNKHKNVLEWLYDSSKQMVVGSIAGVMMLAHPFNPLLVQKLNHQPNNHVLEFIPMDQKDKLNLALNSYLPDKVAPLSPEQETALVQVLGQHFHIPVAAELEGKRLNRNYGYIGAEQHLARFPNDKMESHLETVADQKHYSSGMAPGLGGWRYFDNSEQEKYYIAVPVFLVSGWRENTMELSKFFRYRKMLVVNPENGKAIVAVIGDAGPAEFTGKHLGGSPEVMDYLERQDGAAKGPVLYFFVDDPEDKISLGPVTVQ